MNGAIPADVTFTILCRMSQYQEDQKETVLRKDARLEKDGWERYSSNG